MIVHIFVYHLQVLTALSHITSRNLDGHKEPKVNIFYSYLTCMSLFNMKESLKRQWYDACVLVWPHGEYSQPVSISNSAHSYIQLICDSFFPMIC